MEHSIRRSQENRENPERLGKGVFYFFRGNKSSHLKDGVISISVKTGNRIFNKKNFLFFIKSAILQAKNERMSEN